MPDLKHLENASAALEGAEAAKGKAASAVAKGEYDQDGHNWPVYAVEKLAFKWSVNSSADAVNGC
jgi:hypothetical protein